MSTVSRDTIAITAAETVKTFEDAVSLRCYMIDGNERELALPKGRWRWRKLTETLRAYQWSRIEILTKTGGVCGVYDYPDGGPAPTGLETIGSVKLDVGVGTQQQLLALMLNAQQVALTQQRELVDRVVMAQTAALNAATDRLIGVEKQIALLMKLVQKSTSDNVELSADIGELIADAAIAGAERDPEDAHMEQLKSTVLTEFAKKLVSGAPDKPNGTT